ncbi:MAG: sulfite exporter TauE/SafE family protein, partial [Candidatus Omnitrophica bacterium]|nr:sulfite exporter TauE/SafE family protein [Candidatus Omnitrophota bacterium]
MNLSGNPTDYIFAFLGGIAISFTPCIYPLIPVSVSYIGAKSSSRLKGFILSLIYVSGIALTYSALGLFASLTGKFFGSISSNPLTHILVGAVIMVFGISMFGLFRVPCITNPKVNKPSLNNKNYFSIFLLGAASGFIISPCLSPVLGSILSYLATRKNIAYGISLLASFAYGMGLILILSGTFSGFLTNLPKSGKWMVYFQRLAGVILLATGAYFI